jgi:hypothetical protein
MFMKDWDALPLPRLPREGISILFKNLGPNY